MIFINLALTVALQSLVRYNEKNRTICPKKIAVIGLGQQTQLEIIPALLKIKELFSVQAICDIRLEQIDQTRDFFPLANTYTSYLDLLKQEKQLDSVIVSVPHIAYFDIVKRSLEQSIAVFKEKPFALDAKQADKLYALSKKKKLSIFTVTKRNYYDSYQEGFQYLQRIGNIYQYIARHFVTGGNIHYGWRSTFKDAGGGVLINLGYHLLDILLQYFGSIESASMISSNKGSPDHAHEVEDAATLLLKHKNGVYGSFQFNCYSAVKDESIEVHGTEGVCIIGKSEIKLFDKKGVLVDYQTYSHDGIVANIEALTQFHKRDSRDMQKNIDQHLSIMKVIQMLYESI